MQSNEIANWPIPPADAQVISTSIIIERALPEVWQVLTDFGSYGSWNPYIVRIEGQAIKGTTLSVHACTGPNESILVQSVDVIAASTPVMRWQGGLTDRSEFAGDHWFILETCDTQKTKLNHFEFFSGSKALQILEKYGSRIRQNFILFNESLRAVSKS